MATVNSTVGGGKQGARSHGAQDYKASDAFNAKKFTGSSWADWLLCRPTGPNQLRTNEQNIHHNTNRLISLLRPFICRVLASYMM